MYKLVNYKCISCNYEHSDLLKKIPEEMECPFCGEKMVQFNLKNNKQRVFICDSPWK